MGSYPARRCYLHHPEAGGERSRRRCLARRGSCIASSAVKFPAGVKKSACGERDRQPRPGKCVRSGWNHSAPPGVDVPAAGWPSTGGSGDATREPSATDRQRVRPTRPCEGSRWIPLSQEIASAVRVHSRADAREIGKPATAASGPKVPCAMEVCRAPTWRPRFAPRCAARIRGARRAPRGGRAGVAMSASYGMRRWLADDRAPGAARRRRCLTVPRAGGSSGSAPWGTSRSPRADGRTPGAAHDAARAAASPATAARRPRVWSRRWRKGSCSCHIEPPLL